jgi:hypothetical protein
MNSDYIFNSVATKELNKFSYRPYPLNEEPYNKLKSLNYHKKWDEIFKPNDYKKPLKKIYHWSLPYDHGMYNEGFPHLNTYSTHNYIPVTNPVNKLFPNVGTMASIMKRRENLSN